MAAGWESGMDNAIMFDTDKSEIKVYKNISKGYYDRGLYESRFC